MSNFVERLNKELKENKVTKYRLAKETKASKQTVCNWCDGKSEPTVKYLYKICEYLQVSSDYLIGLNEE